MGHEDLFARRVSAPSRPKARKATAAATLQQIPDYLVESLAIGGVLFVVLYFRIRSADANLISVGEILPVLGPYAIAGCRLLPSARSLFSSVASVPRGQKAVELIRVGLSARKRAPERTAPALIPLERSVRLEKVAYSYRGARQYVIEGVDLDIQAGVRSPIRQALPRQR